MKTIIDLRIEHLMALLQGKELHYIQGFDKETIIYPPQGNITMTKDEFNKLKNNIRQDATIELLNILNKIQKDNKVEL